MKIQLKDYNLEDFAIKEISFCNTKACLINPKHIGTKFTKDNSIFRSSIWSIEGELLSAGFKKFVNWGENPENFPLPKDISKCQLVDKMDGSLCIIDFHNGELSMRTRGTSSYTSLSNFKDFEMCLDKYSQIKDILYQCPNLSLLFEITTPNLKIILDYGYVPDITLIGIINKEDYSYMPQAELDDFASNHKFKRPIRYRFKDLAEMLEKVPSMKGIEGLCVYHQDGQQIHKLKTETYLQLHRFKEHANIESVIDLYFGYEKPSYSEFEEKLTQQFDWECFNMVRGFASQVCDGMKEVNKILSYMNLKVDEVRHLSKKNAALIILQAYGETNRSQFAFSILNGKPLTNDQVKKLLYQVLKNS